MIIFLNNDFNTNTYSYLIGDHRIPPLKIFGYSEILQQEIPPRGTYIFTDRERMDQWELRLFSQLYAHLADAGAGYRVLNNPAKIMSRTELLRMLYREGINNFNVYLVSEKEKPERYPVFIRRAFDHRGSLTGLLNNEKELDKALSDLEGLQEPDEGLLIIEFCAEPVFKDIYRKTSAYRIGDVVFVAMSTHEKNWFVKHGSPDCMTEELYQEEYEDIKNNRHAEQIRDIFELSNIEFGRMDFGFAKGKLQVYEIHTNPFVKFAENDHPNPYRNKSQNLVIEQYCHAMNMIDNTDPAAPIAGKFEHPWLVKKPFSERLKHRYVIKRG